MMMCDGDGCRSLLTILEETEPGGLGNGKRVRVRVYGLVVALLTLDSAVTRTGTETEADTLDTDTLRTL